MKATSILAGLTFKTNLYLPNMMHHKIFAPCLIAGIFSFSQVTAQQQALFNGKNLEGWDTYIGPVYDTLKKSFDTARVLGLNNDKNKVFAVVQEDGQGVIRISGENFGGISTKSEFKNYHLRLEFKWGKKKSPPRKKEKRDSGLLYHAGGKHGVDAGSWMRSQEFQIQEGDCGEYWGVAGGSFEIPARKYNAGFIYDPVSPKILFNEKSEAGRWCMKRGDPEKPSGEWNTIDLYCLDDTAVHLVNGVVVMVLYNSAHLTTKGLTPLDHGKIQIQSEGAEVFYRNIQVEKINKIPAALLAN
jgi:hypothetical protein